MAALPTHTSSPAAQDLSAGEHAPSDLSHCSKATASRAISLNVLSAASPARIAPSRNSPRRFAVLILVQLAIVGHIIWWLMARDSGALVLSPVEPSESMKTLELGQLNAGFIFFCVAILATLLLGRFFCGWACHIVLLQDACLWVMKKCGVTPKPFRARLLPWIPFGLALYMFVWPTARRIIVHPLAERFSPSLAEWVGRPPAWNGWTNHLMVQDFWATFPSPLVAVPFLAICGFATVYFLGAKGFCTYGCPYGGFFGVADRFALGRIRVTDACEGCGHCTAVCTSNVRVHQEVRDFGMIVDPGCMKCMDCVSVCPNDALFFSIAAPVRHNRGTAAIKKPTRAAFDTSWRGELVLLTVFLAGFFAWRGVYDAVPLLMAVGISCCLMFLLWKSAQCLASDSVRFHKFTLRRANRNTVSGWLFLLACSLALALTAQASVVRYHRWRGETWARQITTPNAALFRPGVRVSAPDLNAAGYALAHLQRADSLRSGGLGLVQTPAVTAAIARSHLVRGEYADAETALRRYVEARGPSDDLCVDITRLLLLQGRREDALRYTQTTLALHPEFTNLAALQQALTSGN